MKYTTLAHHRDFAHAIRGTDADEHYHIAAVYLLSADQDLWNRIQHLVTKNHIQFADMSIANCTMDQYNLYSCAKDIYCGTGSLTVSDLVDGIIVHPRMFKLLCNAMSIARYGINALKE